MRGKSNLLYTIQVKVLDQLLNQPGNPPVLTMWDHSTVFISLNLESFVLVPFGEFYLSSELIKRPEEVGFKVEGDFVSSAVINSNCFLKPVAETGNLKVVSGVVFREVGSVWVKDRNLAIFPKSKRFLVQHSLNEEGNAVCKTAAVLVTNDLGKILGGVFPAILKGN